MSVDNETYRILGNLETGMDNIEKSLISINSIIHQSIKDQAAISSRTEKAHEAIVSMHGPLSEAVANGNDWVETKGKAKWIIGLGALGGVGGGSGLGGIISRLFS